MDKRTLGQSGIEVSPIGLGTVKFGRNDGVKYPQGFEIPDEDLLSDLLALAQQEGVNLLDTAPAYGSSEERLGRLLKGQRDQWVICGKAGEEFENGQSFYDFTPDHFKRSLERSLQRLQTDYIDIFMLHSDGYDMQNLSDEIIQTLQDFKSQGLIKAIGASTKTVEGGIRTLEAMDVVMASYNPDYTDEKAVLDYAHKHGKGTLLKKALSSGHANDPAAALQFVFAHPGVTSAIIGTINPRHLSENCAMVRAVTLA